MTNEDVMAERRRRGYWLRLARQHAGPDGGELTQADVAARLGLSGKSGSSISNLEKGRREASATELTRLARLYGVPVNWFSEPRPTNEEMLLEAKRLAGGALEAEAEDWEASQGRGSDPAAADAGAVPPGRRTA